MFFTKEDDGNMYNKVNNANYKMVFIVHLILRLKNKNFSRLRRNFKIYVEL